MFVAVNALIIYFVKVSIKLYDMVSLITCIVTPCYKYHMRAYSCNKTWCNWHLTL